MWKLHADLLNRAVLVVQGEREVLEAKEVLLVSYFPFHTFLGWTENLSRIVRDSLPRMKRSFVFFPSFHV